MAPNKDISKADQRILDLLAAAGVTPQNQGPKPIGVPRDYYTIAPKPTLWGGGKVPFGKSVAFNKPTYARSPLYYDGDQYLPASMPMEQRMALQQALKAGGWYSKNATITLGKWGPADIDAYFDAMTAANAAGTSVEKVLNESAMLEQAAGAEEAGPTQLPVRRITSGADLQSIFKKSSKELIGHEASQEDIDSMVLAYQSLQMRNADQLNDTAWQEQQMAAAGGGRGAPVTIEDPPDPTVFAEQQLKEKYPWQYAGTKGAGVAQTVEDFLYGGR